MQRRLQDLAAEAKELIAEQDQRIQSLDKDLHAAQEQITADAQQREQLEARHDDEVQRLQQQLRAARVEFADMLQSSLQKMNRKLENALAQEASSDAL